MNFDTIKYLSDKYVLAFFSADKFHSILHLMENLLLTVSFFHIITTHNKLLVVQYLFMIFIPFIQ